MVFYIDVDIYYKKWKYTLRVLRGKPITHVVYMAAARYWVDITSDGNALDQYILVPARRREYSMYVSPTLNNMGRPWIYVQPKAHEVFLIEMGGLKYYDYRDWTTPNGAPANYYVSMSNIQRTNSLFTIVPTQLSTLI